MKRGSAEQGTTHDRFFRAEGLRISQVRSKSESSSGCVDRATKNTVNTRHPEKIERDNMKSNTCPTIPRPQWSELLQKKKMAVAHSHFTRRKKEMTISLPT